MPFGYGFKSTLYGSSSLWFEHYNSFGLCAGLGLTPTAPVMFLVYCARADSLRSLLVPLAAFVCRVTRLFWTLKHNFLGYTITIAFLIELTEGLRALF